MSKIIAETVRRRLAVEATPAKMLTDFQIRCVHSLLRYEYEHIKHLASTVALL